jgi:hypothetical protein
VECGAGYDVAIVDAADTVSECERVEVASRPRLHARPLRTGVRPALAVRWTLGDLPRPGRVEAWRVASPADRRGCDVGPWRLRGARLAWRGRRGACPGEYAFAITYVDARRGGPRVACEQLRAAPRGGCAPSERLGVLTLRVV